MRLPFAAILQVLCLVSAFLACPPAGADEPLNEEVLAQEQKAIEAANLPEEQRKKAMEWLAQARQWLTQAQTAQTARRQWEQTLRDAPRRLANIGHFLERPESLTRQWPAVNLSSPLEQMELQLTGEEASLTQTQATLKLKEKELTELLAAATTGEQQIAELERQLREVEAELKNIPQVTAPEGTRRLSLEARRTWLKAERERLRLRQNNLATFTELAHAERDLLVLEESERQRRVERLRQAVQALREHRVLGLADEARLALRTAAREVQPVWEENLNLWRELEAILNEEKEFKDQSQRIKQQIDHLQADLNRIQQAIALAGADEAIARLLYRRLGNLPSTANVQRTADIRRLRQKQAIARRFEIEDLLQQLGETDTLVETAVAKLPATMEEAQRAVIRLQLGEALENRGKALHALQQEYTRYLSVLSELETLKQQWLEVTREYRGFIREKLLWIRHRTSPPSLAKITASLHAALSPQALADLGARILRLAASEPTPLAMILLPTTVLLALRWRARHDLPNIAQATRSIRSDSFLNTLRALVDTLVLAAPLPFLLFCLGGWLKRTTIGDGQLTLLAQGLLLAGRPAAALGFLRQVCRAEGLAHHHLRWLNVTRKQIWHSLRWFQAVAIAAAFTVGASGAASLGEESLGIGRLTYIVFMVTAAVLIWWLWRRNGPILKELVASRRSWVTAYHPLWFPVALLVPAALALAATAGYYYAAFYLAERAFRTLWFFVSLMLIKDFLLRWLYLTERRLRYQEILRKREEMRAQKGGQTSELPPVEEPEVDFGRLSEQTRRLLRLASLFAAAFGLWLIWEDAVPALSFLKEVTLPMTTTRMVGGVPKEVPLTLVDVITGIFLGLLTVLAAKNLPGLLEFAILQRLPMDRGARYAWSALTQYLIVALGIYVIFSSLGIQWTDIQWLIAALSVGLGFGLQEVVANFVSGLILLFERPIRVGDVVTVGDITGTVSRIRIRATTILNWDRQELVIPNKSFITDRFINWTLSDTTNRIVMPVGIAYGSDVMKAMELIREATESHPEILADPKPLITFEGFGDNSLNLILRAYLSSMDNRWSTISDLHQRIYDSFNTAGIEIAFPQRDVHLDTKAPMEVVVRHAAKATEPEDPRRR